METIVQSRINIDPNSNADLRIQIDQILSANKGKPGSLMVILNEVQARIGFVSIPMRKYIAEALKIPASRVHGVVSFYSFFTTEPRGTHTIKFCMGTACYVGGIPQIIDKARQLIGVEPGQTTSDGNITLEACRCVGACSQAPVVVIDEEIHGRVKPSMFARLIRGIDTKEEKA